MEGPARSKAEPLQKPRWLLYIVQSGSMISLLYLIVVFCGGSKGFFYVKSLSALLQRGKMWMPRQVCTHTDVD